jgi:glycosyltransferase involved in cell wall biosynthesis
MHVTHVVAFPPFREGTGTVCYYNAQALRELGCDVTVYAPRLDLSADVERLDFYRFIPCWLAIGNAYLTPQLLSIDRTDLVHLHLPFIFGSELVLAKILMTRLPLVVTYHSDLLSTEFVRRLGFPVYNRSSMPLVLNKARRIVVTSIDYALSSFYGQSIFQRRQKDLAEVPNGIDVDFFRPGIDASAIKARYGLQSNEAVLLFVSSLDPSHARKGLDLLLGALSALGSQPFRLIVVGEGAMRPAYQRRARDMGLDGKVVFAGRVAQEELAAYYSASDMVVIPSRPPEAFGLALAQGMAAGKPVIGSNIPGVRTVVIDGETGFLIEPGDKAALAERIQRLARDADLRGRMGRQGRQRVVQNYTWHQAGHRLLVLYQELLDECQPRSIGP